MTENIMISPYGAFAGGRYYGKPIVRTTSGASVAFFECDHCHNTDGKTDSRNCCGHCGAEITAPYGDLSEDIADALVFRLSAESIG